jgi:hypothetical protein
MLLLLLLLLLLYDRWLVDGVEQAEAADGIGTVAEDLVGDFGFRGV